MRGWIIESGFRRAEKTYPFFARARARISVTSSSRRTRTNSSRTAERRNAAEKRPRTNPESGGVQRVCARAIARVAFHLSAFSPFLLVLSRTTEEREE